ncbi:LysR family transcriptional regulator [Peristeroidobacter soli]|uniref:LysR family transcriptional regulator n=1 Tax=Peristeroidobacter soli TaxID=2497877 RepID=UPI00101BF0C2|nr:LysR family transcriptional regulator [Peristeroidobacter soli]
MVHSTALRYFDEVARTGSLAAASEKLHVAVSAISRQIAMLEREIGADLFERTARGMVLTRPGEVLAEHARRVFLEASAVLAEISSSHAQARGNVRIGCDEGFASLLPKIMAAFHREQPIARFVVRSGSPENIESWVEKGEIDLGLSCSTGHSGNVNVAFSADSPVEVLCRYGHPLARKPSITLDELLAHPLAVPEHDAALRRLLDDHCAAAGKRFEPLLVTDCPAVIHQFTSLTSGVAVGNRLVMQELCARGGFVVKRIEAPQLAARSMQVITMHGRRLPTMVHRFLETLRREMSALDSSVAASRAA